VGNICYISPVNKKLSIITINRNNAEGLKKTIESVVCQTFKDYEYIVIDGASTDESVDIIKKYSASISYWVSEPDGGIYYAMNKGIKVAKGEYCLFLNSGDYLVSNSVLKKVFQYNFYEDIIYGDVIVENHLGQKILIRYNSTLSILNYFKGAVWCFFNHQNSFIKKSLFEKFGFYRTDLKISSDQVFFTKVIFEGGSTYRYIPIAVAVFDTIGISANVTLCTKDRNIIMYELLKYPALIDSMKSIAFYDTVWNTPLVKLWYNFYNAVDELKLKIKRFFGKDFWYNNSKYHKQQNKKFLLKKIKVPKNKKLLVWGTGDDGLSIHKYCNEHKIFIYGFLDSNKEKQQYAFFGRPVFAPEFALENKAQDFFIVIASRNYCEEISEICKKAGLIENKDFVVPFEVS
jgi:glycosyltransferase involved in cell wall biosynthesis